MPKVKRIGKKQASLTIAKYIVDCETGEYSSYVSYCEENELNPNDVYGKGQSNHVYALALIALGLSFPSD